MQPGSPHTSYDYLFIIPAYNESLILESSINLLYQFLTSDWQYRDSRWKILIADNGSTDHTPEVADRLMRQHPDHLLYRHIPVKGRGNALKQVVQSNEADLYLYIDADIPIDPQNIPLLLKPLENTEADLVHIRRIGKRPLYRSFMTTSLRIANLILFKLHAHDSQCGVKAFNQNAAQILVESSENGYYLDTELLVGCQKAHLRLMEISVQWIDKRFPHRSSKLSPMREIVKACCSMARIAIKTRQL